jgi:hypothetical protein
LLNFAEAGARGLGITTAVHGQAQSNRVSRVVVIRNAVCLHLMITSVLKYDKQDQQGKAALNERN